MKTNIIILLLFLATQLFAQVNNYTALHSQYEYVGCFDDEGFATVGNKTYFGVIDSTGKIRLPFSYDAIKKLSDTYYEVIKDHFTGIVDANNQTIVPIEYEEVTSLEKGIFKVKKQGKYGIIDYPNAQKLPCEYNGIVRYKNGLLLAKKDNLMGLLSPQFTVILPFVYANIYAFNEKEIYYSTPVAESVQYLHIVQQGKKGIVDSLGKIIIPHEYHYIEAKLSQGLWICEKQEKYGLIDKQGKMIVPFIYRDISFDEINGYFIVRDTSRKSGIMDNTGKFILPLKYDYLEELGKNTYVVDKDSIVYTKKKYIPESPSVTNNAINIDACKAKEDTSRFDKKIYTQQAVFNITTNTFSHYYDKLEVKTINHIPIAIATKNDKVGILNSNGEEIIPLLYEYIEIEPYDIEESDKNTIQYFNLQKNDLHGMANDKGKVIIPCKYEEIERNADYFFLLKKHKYQLAHKDKGLLSTHKYQSIDAPYYYMDYRYKEANYFKVLQKDKQGILSFTGKQIIPCKYENIGFLSTNFYEVEKNHKKALFNQKGKKILPFVYDKITQVGNQNAFRCLQNEKYGIIDSTGKTIIPFIYDYLYGAYGYDTAKTYIVARKDTQHIYFNLAGKVIPKPYISNILSFQKNKGYGYRDNTGKEIIPFSYALKSYSEDEFDINGQIILSNIKKKGLMNTQNETIVPALYEKITILEYIIIIEQNNLYGVLDKKGNSLLPLEYNEIFISQYPYRIQKEGKIGLIDEYGKIITPCIYEDIMSENTVSIVKKNKLYGLIDLQNKLLIPFIYEELRYLGNGFLSGKKEDKYDVLYSTGKVILSHQKKIELYSHDDISYLQNKKDIMVYSEMGKFIGKNFFVENDINKDAYYIVNLLDKKKMRQKEGKLIELEEKLDFTQNKYGVIDSVGAVLIPCIYDNIYDSYDGYLIAHKGDKTYKLDKTGKSVIPEGYEIRKYFNYGLIAAGKDNKWGFLNDRGAVVIPLIYDLVSDFTEGRAVVYQQEKCGIIDTTGKIIVPIQYEGLEILYGGYLKVKMDCKFGILDATGKIAIPILYDYIETRYAGSLPLIEPTIWEKWDNIIYNPSMFLSPPSKKMLVEKRYYNNILVMQNKKIGVVDITGKILIPIQYENLIRLNTTYFQVKDSLGLMGLINTENKMIVKSNYTSISEFAGKGFILHCLTGKYDYYDISSQQIIVAQCDRIIGYENEVFIFQKEGKIYERAANGKISEIDCE